MKLCAKTKIFHCYRQQENQPQKKKTPFLKQYQDKSKKKKKKLIPSMMTKSHRKYPKYIFDSCQFLPQQTILTRVILG